MISELARMGPPLGGRGLLEGVAKERPAGATESKDAKVESFDSQLKRGLDGPKTPERRAEISQPRKVEGPPNKQKSEKTSENGPIKEVKAEKNAEPNKEVASKEIEGESERPKIRGANAKEKAMLKFMDSLESEFGVSPTRIVEAMANIKAVDLGRTPEQTADQVIENLKLEPEQSTRARGLYEGMLTELSTLGMAAGAINATGANAAPIVQGNAIVQNSSLMMSRDANGKGFILSDDNMKRLSLNSSLEKMNEKFWMKGAVQGSSQLGKIENGQLAQLQNLGQREGGFDLAVKGNQGELELYGDLANVEQATQSVGQQKLSAEQATLLAMGIPLAISENPEAQELGLPAKVNDYQVNGEVLFAKPEMAVPNEALELQGLRVPMESQSLPQPVAPLDEREGKILQALKLMPALYGLQKSVESIEGKPLGQKSLQGVELPTASVMAASGDANQLSETQMQETGDEENQGENSEFFNQAAMGAEGKPRPVDVTKVGAAFTMSGLSNKNSEEADPNVRQLMNQAQYLIRKGGGEMNVQMTPEGLGQVHLKLSIEDGKVNVEMAAQNSETKKLIENSVSDLRSQLAGHKLQVESIRVDVAPPPKEAMNQQLDLSYQDSRQQAQQFLQEFRQNSWGRAKGENFYEKTGLKTYGARPSPLQPASDKVGPRANPHGSSLNLVA